MKKSLREQIERIYTLTYGKNLVKEGFLDDLLGREVDEQTKTIDEPKKADNVGKDNQGNIIADDKLVQDFYATFEKAIASGGLKQQSQGSMLYQKEVESMQIGLTLLGYQLPQHGVDGLFGPETAAAVQKFTTDNKIETAPTSGATQTTPAKPINESVRKISLSLLEAALDSPLDNTSINSPFGTRWGGQGHNGVDLKADSSNVKAPADGVVEVGEIRNDACGGTIIISHAGGFKTGFCHMQKINVTAGQQVKQGDVIGISGGGANDVGHGRSDGRHLHFTLRKDGQLVNPIDYIDKSGIVMTGGVPQSSQTSQVSNTSATPEMLKKLLELVKAKNLTAQDLKKYMDKVIQGGAGSIDVKDWQGIINTIIDNLEGGYYHPDMLRDGRVKDSRYGSSGETMYGIDRKTGPESKTPLGQEFWAVIDAQPDKGSWKNEYMAKDKPELYNKLRGLVGQMIKPFFDKYTKTFLTPEAASIVAKDPALQFHFAYATFNGSGWFQRFARVVNEAVRNGNTDPKSLLQLASQDRLATGNSLMTQVGRKVNDITAKISRQSPTTQSTATAV